MYCVLNRKWGVSGSIWMMLHVVWITVMLHVCWRISFFKKHRLSMSMYLYENVYKCVYIYIYIYVCVCVCVCVCADECVCVCACMHNCSAGREIHVCVWLPLLSQWRDVWSVHLVSFVYFPCIELFCVMVLTDFFTCAYFKLYRLF